MFRNPSSFRPLFWLVPGLVLLLAACGPQTNGKTPQGMGVAKPTAGDAALVEVNGTLITQMDLEREAAAQGLIQPGERLTPGSKAYKNLLEELIDQRLLALQAVKEGLDKDPEAKTRIRLARERILGNVLVEHTVNKAVTEEQVKKLYEAQAKLGNVGEEVRARHILVDTEKQAEAVRQALVNGASFATLAFEKSKDASTRLEGGDLGYFTRDSMVEPLAEAAFSLKDGEISQPIHTRYGWHILQVEGRRKAEQPTLEEVRPQIVRFMTFDEIQKLVSNLRADAKIEHLDGNLIEDAQKTDASEMDDGPGTVSPDTGDQPQPAQPESKAQPQTKTPPKVAKPEPQPAPTPEPAPQDPPQ